MGEDLNEDIPEVPLLQHVDEPSHEVHVGVELDLAGAVEQDVVVIVLT